MKKILIEDMNGKKSSMVSHLITIRGHFLLDYFSQMFVSYIQFSV